MLCSLTFFILQATLLYMGAYAQQDNGVQEIQWGSCSINGTIPLVCGNISVPLDYSDPNSTDTLAIELIKAPAIKEPSKGNIVINFGGPGASGQELIVQLGPVLQAITGGYYDLVSFDPRGAGKTIPLSCHKTAEERINATFMNPNVNGNASDTTLGRLWASGENFATACYENGKDIGGLVGFAFTARDIMHIAEALNDDGLLRYYGLSGGTPLGATIAAMFPDRIDRMILDGVWNIHEYSHYHAVEGFSSTDATFSGFLRACIAAGPPACALAHLNLSAPALEAAVYALIDDAKYHPLPYAGTLIDYTLVRNTVFLALATLALWPALATFLAALLTADTALLGTVWGALQKAEDPVFTEHRFGIQCGDKAAPAVRTARSADVVRVVEELARTSRLAGDRIAFDVAACARWKMDAREVYWGDFRVRARRPPLIVGNTLDPVTPLVSARNASASLLGSVVLQQDGFGHCSPQQPSVCTAKAIQAYLDDGTLPEPGSICAVDVPPFSNLTWKDVLPL